MILENVGMFTLKTIKQLLKIGHIIKMVLHLCAETGAYISMPSLEEK